MQPSTCSKLIEHTSLNSTVVVHLSPDTASEAVRTASLEIFLTEGRVIHVEDLDPQLVSLLLEAEAGVITRGRPGAHSQVRLRTTELRQPLYQLVQAGCLQRHLAR